ncbi:hypothetical protein OBP_231 [Pseudomonas phage OBP]|uniref:hypothetical protein n=1 Tax=Pseudomonas phage OBP TaxID=1124849 RepID=UPI000240D5CB|nr:hypothetical protein OBP_231 [Pseudomonas phage OBP]AEV89668.1 hypothetical protein OBP_231 [Pseudomonas phage OBP]
MRLMKLTYILLILMFVGHWIYLNVGTMDEEFRGFLFKVNVILGIAIAYLTYAFIMNSVETTIQTEEEDFHENS